MTMLVQPNYVTKQFGIAQIDESLVATCFMCGGQLVDDGENYVCDGCRAEFGYLWYASFAERVAPDISVRHSEYFIERWVTVWTGLETTVEVIP